MDKAVFGWTRFPFLEYEWPMFKVNFLLTWAFDLIPRLRARPKYQYSVIGVGRYIVFALESSFRDIQEDLVSISVSSISRNLAENSFPFSAFPGTSSKSRFCIFCNFLFFFPVFSCYFLFFSVFSPVFSSFFPVFLVFCWKMMCLVSSCFPFMTISRLEFCIVSHFSPISRLELRIVSHFSPRIASF